MRTLTTLLAVPLGLLASDWITGSYAPPAETDTAAFFADAPNDVVEKRFPVRNAAVTRALWRVAAPGMRDLCVNGRRVCETALPPWTPYAKRILEETFDVTAFLKPGAENILRVDLGNGWYNPLPQKMWYHYNMREKLAVGVPCVRATLEIAYADGSCERVATDASWRAAAGAVVRNNIYRGERTDARRTPAFDRAARRIDGPVGKVVPAGDMPKTIVYRRWPAKRVYAVSNNVWVVDMGVNFAGTFRARLHRVRAGQDVRFLSGERLYDDGSVNPMTAVAGQIKNPAREPLFGVAEQCDSIICRTADVLEFEPRFAFHVFRYLQVTGLTEEPRAEDFEALAWSADVRDRSAFFCSNEKLNNLHEVCRRTFRSNLQSVQSDCPGREKFGYGGDIACTADAFWCNYDMHGFYRKTIRDFLDEAADDGVITETAPYVGIGSNGVFPKTASGRKSAPMGWAVGVPILLDTLVRYAGDTEIVREAYPTLVRYLDLIRKTYPNDDIPACLGDWIPVSPGEKTDTKLSALIHERQFVLLTAKFARLLGRAGEAKAYARWADALTAKIRRDFVRAGVVAKGSQGDQVFALHHGIVRTDDIPAARARLLADIRGRDTSLTTGIFGTKYLLEYLSATGEADCAGKIVTHRGFPGWFDMIDRGATTLWESWSEKDCLNVYSNCHPMFGSVDEWLVRHVLGIAVCDDAVGCDRVRIDPKPVAGVTFASGWFDTPRGRITVSWRLKDGKLAVDRRVPPGVTVVP